MPLFKKSEDINGIDYTWWYWSSSPTNDPTAVTKPAALYSTSGLPISSLPSKSDVIAPRSISFTLTGSPGVAVTVVEDGGNLDFTLSTAGTKKANLSGLFFDFTNTKLSTLSVAGPQISKFVTQSNSVVGLYELMSVFVNLANGLNLNGFGLPLFDVGIQFGLSGQSQSFVLSDAAKDLSINDLHPTGETGSVGAITFSPAENLAAVAPYAPAATPDTVTTPEHTPITIQASALATDKNRGAVLTIDKIGTGAQGPQYGTVQIAADGKSLIYTATTLDYVVGGIVTGDQDAFQVSLKDNSGGEVTSFVTVNATPVAHAPSVSVKVLAPDAGDPINEVRLLVTAQSADYGNVNAGSDSIQSVGLNLAGDVTTGITITDSDHLLNGNTINASGNNTTPGLFTDEVDLLLPANSTLNDTLAVTATAAETEAPATKATSAAFNQSIGIDNVQSQTDLNFQTSGQSIWNTGPAGVNENLDTGFLGLGTKTLSFNLGTSGAFGSASVNAKARAGVQAELSISTGNFKATLPFQINLDSTYNKTTDTLQITASDIQLKGGHFTAAGVTGAFNFGLDFGLKGSAKLTLVGTGLKKTFPVGSFTKPVYTWGVKSTAKFGSFGLVSSRVPIPKDVATLSLGAPRVTTKGSNPNTGSTMISGTGTSTNMVKLNADLVQLAENFGLPVPSIEKFTAAIEGDKSKGFISVTTLVAILSLSLDLIQKFDLTDSGGLTPTLLVDGHQEPLKLDGSPLTIHNASSLGPTPFDISLGLVPTNPTVTNKTALGANGKVSMTALSFSVGAIGLTLGPFGPAYKNTNLKLFGTSVPLYSNTFALQGFGTQTVTQKV